LRALVRRAIEKDWRPRRLREARTFAEALPEDLRALCRAAWNVKLCDVYSAEEAGYIALQCPDHEHYHVQSENLIVEVIDERGEPCRAGEMGRVVVTTLTSFAMPLIRYEIGDYAVAGAPCPCGRGLPVIERVLGGTRNLLRLPDGPASFRASRPTSGRVSRRYVNCRSSSARWKRSSSAWWRSAR
jgi:phenylacetate-CoA ligase